jgi:hypothetical protein
VSIRRAIPIVVTDDPDGTRAFYEGFLATESLGSPVRAALRITLPGAAARRRLLVRGTTTVVAIRLGERQSTPFRAKRQ